MGSLSKDIDMASRGWSLWDGIVSRNPDGGKSGYFVFFDNDRITPMALELFGVLRKREIIGRAVIITDIEKMQDWIQTDEQIRIERVPRYDLDCILKYYSLHKFSDSFYVLSLDKFEQCCLKPVADELSLEEVILRGLFRLSKI